MESYIDSKHSRSIYMLFQPDCLETDVIIPEGNKRDFDKESDLEAGISSSSSAPDNAAKEKGKENVVHFTLRKLQEAKFQIEVYYFKPPKVT